MRFILLFIFYLFSMHANGASFDCSRSATLNEKRICVNPTLSKLDDDMAVLYRKLVSTMGDTLKSQQVLWVKIQRACRDEACLISVYESRINELADELNSIIRSENLPKDIQVIVSNWSSSNALCRSSQLPATDVKACGERESLSSILEARGWCFGNGTSIEAEYDKIWQKCKR